MLNRNWEFLFQHACNRRSWTRLSMWLMRTSWRRTTFQYWSSCMSVCAWLIAILNPCMLRQIFIVWHSDPFPFHFILTYCTESMIPWTSKQPKSAVTQSLLRNIWETNRDIATRVDVPSRVRYWSEKEETNQWFLGPIPCLWAATAIIETCTSTLLSDWWNLSRMSMAPFPLV